MLLGWYLRVEWPSHLVWLKLLSANNRNSLSIKTFTGGIMEASGIHKERLRGWA